MTTPFDSVYYMGIGEMKNDEYITMMMMMMMMEIGRGRRIK